MTAALFLPAVRFVGTWAAVVAIMAGLCASGQAAQSLSKTVFERAEFVLSDEAHPPADSAAWKPVSLPDEWRRTIPGAAGHGWYRITFDLVRASPGMHAIYLAYRRSYWIDYFVNGNLVGGSDQWAETTTALTLLGPTVYVPVPPYLLRSGRNVIHLRMRATSAAAAMQGLSRVTFGAAREVRKDYIRQIELEHESLRSSFAVALSAGLIAFCLWLARRDDRVMLLLAIAYLSWAFVTGWQRPLRWVELPTFIRSILQVSLTYGLPPLAVLLCLRTVRLDRRWVEMAVWAYLAAIVTLPLWGTSSGEEWRLVLEAVNTGLLLAGVAVIATHAKQPLRWAVTLQIATLLLMAALISSEFMRYFGWIHVDTPAVRHFHVLAMFIGIGTAIFADHVVAVWRARNMNMELERRVAEKTREIEVNHARMEEAKREQALARERRRIVSDMHDGLGASLVSLLRYAQTKHGDPRIEQHVKEALQELRIAIDALEPSAGDLASVLGNLRYRLAPLLETTAARLDWEVGELPPIQGLEPWAVFALQRIVLEAVANAVKHSNARHIALTARGASSGGVEIRVEDDGAGFDAAQPSTGSGIPHMHARAGRIGARLEISSRGGAGTLLRLMIPPVLAAMHDDPASGIADPRLFHELLPAANRV